MPFDNDVTGKLSGRFPRSYGKQSMLSAETARTIEILRAILRFGDTGSIDTLYDREPWRSDVPKECPLIAADTPVIRSLIETLGGHAVRSEIGRAAQPTLYVNVVRAVRPILRGYVECIEAVPVMVATSAVVQYITIAGLPNVLDRENHGYGWHYHYCNSNGQRSDTVLLFDTKQPKRYDERRREIPLRDNSPLFWETHSEKNKKFEARPGTWGRGKRVSVFSAAQPDLTKLQAHDFRRPKDEAQPVWPLGSVLSSKP